MIAAEQQLLTREEAAEYLRVKPRTLQAWAMQGYGPPIYRIGRLARYRREDLEGWIEAQLELKPWRRDVADRG